MTYLSYLLREAAAKAMVSLLSKGRGPLRFAGIVGDHISIRIGTMGFYERHILDGVAALIRCCVPPRGGVVLDVGANIGNHALYLSRLVRKVIAYEPHPHLFELLRLNCDMNRVNNVECRNLGLSDAEAVLHFVEPLADNMGKGFFTTAGAGDGTLRMRVERGDRSLSESDARDLVAVKIDTEGHELKVLQGLRDSLSQSSPVVLFETRATEELLGCAEVLRRLGYSYFYSCDYPFRDSPRTLRVFRRILCRSRPAWKSVELATCARGDFSLICASKSRLPIDQVNSLM